MSEKETRTIKVKNSYIAKVMPVIMNGQMMPNPVAESLKKKKIPTRVQYWSRRALDKIARLFKAYDETRQEIIKQHGKKDEKGEVKPDKDGNITIENMADLQKDINDLLEEEVDLGINLIKVDLKAWEEDKRYDILSGEEMDLLWPILRIE